MRRACRPAVALTLLLCAGIGAGAGAAAAGADSEQDVRAADARRIAAMVQADAAGMTATLAEDLTYAHTSAQVDTRETLIASITSGKLDYQSIEPSDVRVRLYGETAVMTGRADIKVKAGGNELTIAARFTSVWVRHDGHWQMVAWQSTRLP